MTEARTSRRPGLRTTGVLLSALAVAASPLAAGPAHAQAAGGTEPFLVSLSLDDPSGADGTWPLGRAEEYAGGTVYDLKGGNITPEHGVDQPGQQYTVESAQDGRIHLKNNASGQCLGKVPEGGTYPGDLTDSACNDVKAEWYVQPAGDKYRIRSVENDSCMSVSDAVRWGIGRARECGGDDAKQLWHISGKDVTDKLAALATAYALKQCSNASGVIASCDYEIDRNTDSTASVGKLELVGVDRTLNGTASVMKRAIGWKQTTSQTNTVGGSMTITAELGFNVGVVNGKVSNAVSAKYEHSWVEGNEVSDTNTIDVNPNQWSWVLRGQLMKTVNGKWTFTNDRGEQWSGVGTATVPAKNGTDSQISNVVLCTSDSARQECQDTRP
ncbi:hypothetical protein GCM10010513_34100 [Streptomyces glebosus]|nr:hypothetical protein GCM10010513_34100 [Streptomyces glebosus]